MLPQIHSTLKYLTYSRQEKSKRYRRYDGNVPIFVQLHGIAKHSATDRWKICRMGLHSHGHLLSRKIRVLCYIHGSAYCFDPREYGLLRERPRTETCRRAQSTIIMRCSLRGARELWSQKMPQFKFDFIYREKVVRRNCNAMVSTTFVSVCILRHISSSLVFVWRPILLSLEITSIMCFTTLRRILVLCLHSQHELDRWRPFFSQCVCARFLFLVLLRTVHGCVRERSIA